MKRLVTILLSITVVFAALNFPGNAETAYCALTEKIPSLSVCKAPPEESLNEAMLYETRLFGAAADDRAMALPYAKSNTFKLHSKKDSKKTIYLDFNGHTTTNSLWNYYFGSSIFTPPFSIEGEVSANFSDKELAAIQQIWQEVADDYSLFDVDVTTEEPALSDLEKAVPPYDRFGMRACIGGKSSDWLKEPNVLGVAFLNTFGIIPSSGTTRTPPAMIFSADVLKGYNDTYFAYLTKYVAGIISHEVGHTFGLEHDGKGSQEYYGAREWGPIMGYAYGHVIQWSKGEYAGATNQEDDIAIVGKTLGYITDDAGNTTSTAAAITPGTTKKGIIGKGNDIDYYKFTLSKKAYVTVSVNAGLAFNGANLDPRLSLYNSSGGLIASDDSTSIGSSRSSIYNADFETAHSGMTAKISRDTISSALPPGTYYLSVEGTGYSSYYTKYGSVGNYTVSVTKKDVIETTGVKLNKKEINLFLLPGVSENLTATVTPSNADIKNVSWSSSNPAVVSMIKSSSAVAIIPEAPGTTVITAKTVDTGLTATCTVTVKIIDVTGLALDKNEISLLILPDVSEKITATITPAIVSNSTIRWTSSNTNAATITSNGNTVAVTPKSPGTTVITAKTDDGGYTASCTVTVKAPDDEDWVNYYHSMLVNQYGAQRTYYLKTGGIWPVKPPEVGNGVTVERTMTTDVQSGTYFTLSGNNFTITRPSVGWTEQIGDTLAVIPYYKVTYTFTKGAAQKEYIVGAKIPPGYMLGDIDRNGTVNSADALLALKLISGVEYNDWHDPCTFRTFPGAILSSNALTAGDVLQILRYCAGYPNLYQIGKIV